MAQPPHYPQMGQGIPVPNQQSLNLQQMLAQKPTHGPSAMQTASLPGYQSMPQPPAEKTPIDTFEAAYQSCIMPLVPGNDNCANPMVSPDRLRFSIEHSIQQFTDAARAVESYFIRKHAIVAQQQPELVLQEEIEELSQEIARRDQMINSHASKVRSWQDTLKNLQVSVNERSGPSTPTIPNPSPVTQPPGMMHPDMVQMQRR